MLRGQWRFFIVTVLMFNAQGALAEEAWLVIFSGLPGAIISVNGVYRGVTPQHSEDALQVKVAEGICEIGARLQIGGRAYAQRQATTAVRDQETVIRFGWNPEPPPTLITTTTLPTAIGIQKTQPFLPIDGLEVPGRNF